ncbi:hypothetical protein Tco_0032514 [Tanacetum coccineum]
MLDAYESSISYKERTKRWHDKQIKLPINYEKGDKVLLFNKHLRLFPGKLKSRWYGPFTVSKDMKNGAIELYDEEGSEFIVNKQRVKPYQKNLLDTNKDDDVTLDDEGEVTSQTSLRFELTDVRFDSSRMRSDLKFLLQLQPEWQRFVTLVKQSKELKTVSYYKLYDILKQHQTEVNEIRQKRLARTAKMPQALVAQPQPVYHHQNHPTPKQSIFLHQIATV